MPNHFHGILIIDGNDAVTPTAGNGFLSEPAGNGHARSLPNPCRGLPDMIGSFKSAVSRRINQISADRFRWQKSYYDHIIRNEKSLADFRWYIRQNPAQWHRDRNKPAYGTCHYTVAG